MKISVITATYNSSATVLCTMKSLFNQTHKDWQWIVVDGKSSDGTVELIKENIKKFSMGGGNNQIQIISEKDNGLYDAMNKGISMAKGDVIGILNSDDFYTSNDILETINKTFEYNDCDAVYGDIHFVRENNLSKCVRYYSSKNFKRKKMIMGFMPAHPSFYCRKYVYQNYGLFNTQYRIAADFEQLLRLIYKERIQTKYIEKDFVTMRMGGVSTSGFESRRQIMKEQLRAFKENHIKTNIFLLSLRYIIKLTEYLKTSGR